jgi:hypothetical protein
MYLFKKKTEKGNKDNKTNRSRNRNYMNRMRQLEQQARPHHRPHNVTSSNFQNKLTLTQLLSFLNPSSQALREPAKIDLKTTLKAKAVVGAIDVAAVAVKMFTSIDITHFRKALDFFKNKKTGISESYYVLIETCLTDIQIILNYNEIKTIIERFDLDDIKRIKKELAIEISKQFDMYTGLIIQQFIEQLLIFIQTIKAYAYFLVNYNSVYHQIKKEFGFGLEEVIELFKEQLMIMQTICNRTNSCLDQHSHYVEYKKSSSITQKLTAYMKGQEAAVELEKVEFKLHTNDNKPEGKFERKIGEKIIFQ